MRFVYKTKVIDGLEILNFCSNYDILTNDEFRLDNHGGHWAIESGSFYDITGSYINGNLRGYN